MTTGFPRTDRSLGVVIADDSVLLREGLSELLNRWGHRVLAQAEDVDSLLAAVERHGADVVICDVRMPPAYHDEGVRAAHELRRLYPTLGVLLLSHYNAPHHMLGLFAGDAVTPARATTGGLGFLVKDRVSNVHEFVATIHEIATGGTVIDPEVAGQLMTSRSNKDELRRLSRRELEVLSLVAQGRSNRATAAALEVSEAAIAKHIRSIFTKLNLPAEDDTNRRVMAVLRYLEG
jgi:DNA-binding NarL/FixJ family response regulator